MGFHIKLFFVSYHFLTSKSVILVDYSRVLANDVFLYLHLFMLTYVSPIRYVIDWEDNVLDKNQLAWNLAFSPVVRGFYRT